MTSRFCEKRPAADFNILDGTRVGNVLVGCSPGPTPPAGFAIGTSLHTINVGGVERSYRLYKPAGLAPSASLVVMLHGGFGNAAQAERSYNWDELADSHKFVIAYPDGLHRAWNANGGGCCGRPARDGVDDLGFLVAAVADIVDNVSINFRAGVCHRHEQRRHHVLHAGLQHCDIRRDWPGFGNTTGPLPVPAPGVGDAYLARPIGLFDTEVAAVADSLASTVRRCPS